MRATRTAVFFAVAALLAMRASRLHIAATFLNPVGRVDTQNEAMYAQRPEVDYLVGERLVLGL